MNEQIKLLYDYLKLCNEKLTLAEIQFINLKLLEIVEKYLPYISNQDIIRLYNKSKDYWQRLDQNNQNNDLLTLHNEICGLKENIFDMALDNIDDIILKFLFSINFYHYNRDEQDSKEMMDQSLDFNDYLISLADQKIKKRNFIKNLTSISQIFKCKN